MDDRTRMRLRAQLATAPRSGPGKGLPRALRLEVAQHAATRRADGTPIAQIARELGINAQTLRRWMLETRDAFGVVHVVPHSVAPATFTLTGPSGIRVEGLDLDALAALLRRLAS
jgi:predicted transcriptional regulator